MKDLKKVLKKEPIAFIPEYVKDKGNLTKVITKDLEVYYLRNRLNTVLKEMAKKHLVDINVVKKYIGDILGGSRVLPLFFDAENIFVPIKVRKPLNSNDSCYGYINLDYLKLDEEKNLILIDNKLEINVVQRIETIKGYIKRAEIIKEGYINTPFIALNERNTYELINRPVTKLDMAILRHELLNIKKLLLKLKNKKDKK
ncbi:MAG: hypothetical protein FH753_03060 [Firmicutes bacterium]|nr:hypothetical protein [Bacillota bacterium]